MCIYRITKFYFRFHFISFGYCHIAHIITKANKFCSLPVMPASCSTYPYIDLLHYFFILPMTYHYFSVPAAYDS